MSNERWWRDHTLEVDVECRRSDRAPEVDIERTPKEEDDEIAGGEINAEEWSYGTEAISRESRDIQNN